MAVRKAASREVTEKEPKAVPGRDLPTQLRSAIVDGALPPGTRLKFAELAKRYGSSYGTLREALSLLASEGFVTQEMNKGFSVAPVSHEELLEITEHYVELENRALAKSIAEGDDLWEANIVAANHRLTALEKLPWEDRVAAHSDWVLRHREFHESLVATCRGTWLFRLRTLMFDQLDRYRFVTKMSFKKGGASRNVEHRRLMEAVIGRDTEAACDILEQHVRKTADRAAKLLS